MPADDEDKRGQGLQRSLGVSPRQVADVVGRSLREHYREVVKEDVPESLKPLVERIEQGERTGKKTSGRQSRR
jgi:hypothetical protein